ncbi:MAG TPA: hypothetical protein VHM89_14890 [Acidimicrobiales bacterium]|nr:hypothetical protein [Acidimicrobiales bacterium]
MVAVRVAVFVAGAALVAWSVSSAVRTMVIPRALQSVIARGVFEAVRGVLRIFMRGDASYERRDAVMALFGPVSMLLLPAVWLAIVHAGFSCMYWGLGSRSARAAYELSGSSLFTLGSRVGDLPSQTLGFAEAGMGIGLLALLITYLPSLYGTFNRREVAVALLEVRADNPPSGPNMIIRYHRIGWDGGLTAVWKDWETWFADLEETHTSLPALVFFRSAQPAQSWVTAAGAVLDGAALRTSTVDGPREPEADLCIRAGYVALRHLADFFQIPYDPDPQQGDPVSVTREEYDDVCDRMAAAGVPLKADRDQAWLDFTGWRVNYDAPLIALASLTMAPQAPWSSDRKAPFRRPPLVVRPGRSRRQSDGSGPD